MNRVLLKKIGEIRCFSMTLLLFLFSLRICPRGAIQFFDSLENIPVYDLLLTEAEVK
jgi:hypothetical protein